MIIEICPFCNSKMIDKSYANDIVNRCTKCLFELNHIRPENDKYLFYYLEKDGLKHRMFIKQVFFNNKKETGIRKYYSDLLNREDSDLIIYMKDFPLDKDIFSLDKDFIIKHADKLFKLAIFT